MHKHRCLTYKVTLAKLEQTGLSTEAASRGDYIAKNADALS